MAVEARIRKRRMTAAPIRSSHVERSAAVMNGPTRSAACRSDTGKQRLPKPNGPGRRDAITSLQRSACCWGDQRPFFRTDVDFDPGRGAEYQQRFAVKIVNRGARDRGADGSQLQTAASGSRRSPPRGTSRACARFPALSPAATRITTNAVTATLAAVMLKVRSRCMIRRIL